MEKLRVESEELRVRVWKRWREEVESGIVDSCTSGKDSASPFLGVDSECLAAALGGRQAAQGRPQRRADQESGTQGPPHVRGEGEAVGLNAGCRGSEELRAVRVE